MVFPTTGFKVTTAPFAKVRGSAAFDAAKAEPNSVVEVIVKVGKPGYVPPTVTLRSRIDDLMMTAETRVGNLPDLDRDPTVVSVSVSRPLRLVR